MTEECGIVWYNKTRALPIHLSFTLVETMFATGARRLVSLGEYNAGAARAIFFHRRLGRDRFELV